MAVKINKALETPGGAEIPSGAIAVFTTTFPPIELKMILQFVIYKDLATVQAKGTPLREVDGIRLAYEMEFELADLANLDNAAIETEAKKLIEGNEILGPGTCETITKDQLQPS